MLHALITFGRPRGEGASSFRAFINPRRRCAADWLAMTIVRASELQSIGFGEIWINCEARNCACTVTDTSCAALARQMRVRFDVSFTRYAPRDAHLSPAITCHNSDRNAGFGTLLVTPLTVIACHRLIGRRESSRTGAKKMAASRTGSETAAMIVINFNAWCTCCTRGECKNSHRERQVEPSGERAASGWLEIALVSLPRPIELSARSGGTCARTLANDSIAALIVCAQPREMKSRSSRMVAR